MKNNFNEKPELIEVEINLLKEKANQRSFIFIDRPIKQNSLLDRYPILGYGSCRSCNCRGYISKHNGTHECKVCGHHYDRHN